MRQRMPDFEHIRPVKERVEAKLRTYPGVHAVGIGEKYVDGKPTGEPSILVLVVEKKPLGQLKPEEVVPSEIEGIKTDVLAVPMPRLLMAANPNNIIYTPVSSKSFRLDGQPKPGAGLLVTVEFTATPTSFKPPLFAITKETSENDTLESIAARFTDDFNSHDGLGLQALRGGSQVTVTEQAGGTFAISNVTITAVDDHKYFDDWVRGGIQIAVVPDAHGSGTLGCIATTKPTLAFPQGQVVGLTNHHVVRPETTSDTNLAAALDPTNSTQIIVKSTDGKPITPRSVLAVVISNSSLSAEAEYLTVEGNTPTDVVSGTATVITGLALSGVTASPAGSTLTVTGGDLLVTARGPLGPKGDFSAAVDKNSIAFNGTVEGDDCGIYLDIFPGNSAPSFGVFVNSAKNANGNVMATKVWEAFKALPGAVKGSVTMDEPSANVITLHNIEVVESRITHDIRVGQPDPSFGSSCCHCCSHRIGRVLNSRFDLDVALIQLDPGIKYKPEIQDLGLVPGVEPPAQDMTVLKRGSVTQRTTPATGGTIRVVNLTGSAQDTLRFYDNSLLIQSVNTSPFAAPGDSGSAVVNSASNKVVGLLWGGADIWGYATPIDLIVAAFPDLALDFAPAPATGQDAHAVRVVPKPAAHMVAAADPRARAVPSMSSPPIRDRLLEAEKEVIASPAGRRYAGLIRSHFDEGLKLINGNRKVATAWHRNGGPELLQAIFRVIQLNDQRLPTQVQGRPLSECLTQILRVMSRYASPLFAADLELHGPRLAGMAGFSYNDVLSTLESWSEEQ